MGVKYQCTSCNYQFTMQTERAINGCPYCGKKSLRTVSRGQSNADKIVQSA
ncbi:hypothetical protein KY363_06505 [Candidatus Woesearchaeota archaeon]|nr:hypothetical protein [Candidatus Woesearchaeota archaeon]